MYCTHLRNFVVCLSSIKCRAFLFIWESVVSTGNFWSGVWFCWPPDPSLGTNVLFTQTLQSCKMAIILWVWGFFLFVLGSLHVVLPRKFYLNMRKNFTLQWPSTGTNYPERLWSLPYLRYPSLDTILCHVPCLSRDVGLDDPLWTLPTCPILWFCACI